MTVRGGDASRRDERIGNERRYAMYPYELFWGIDLYSLSITLGVGCLCVHVCEVCKGNTLFGNS